MVMAATAAGTRDVCQIMRIVTNAMTMKVVTGTLIAMTMEIVKDTLIAMTMEIVTGTLGVMVWKVN